MIGACPPRPRVLVVQRGARHNYAIPRMLHREGLLAALYTDSSRLSPLGRLAASLPPALRPASAERLVRRRIGGVPPERVRSTDVELMGTRRGTVEERITAGEAALSRRFTAWGTAGADLVYAMLGEGLAFLQEAKGRGLRVAVDLYTTPMTHRIYEAERAAYPEWGEARSAGRVGAFLDDRMHAVLDVADVVTCPSDAVVHGLTAWGAPASVLARTCVVPYSAAYPTETGRPTPGRVLFSGSVVLGKGIHYLAQAAETLRARRVAVEVLMAGGGATPEAEAHLRRAGVRLLGRVPREAMRALYAEADVFVLPTLAEGSASVVYEAMAAGVPVVTTPSAGSIIRNGADGVLVSERDPGALADAVQELVEDRAKRDRIAAAAHGMMRAQGEDVWQRRLVAALTDDRTNPSPSSHAVLAG